jgi:hypothetical protein
MVNVWNIYVFGEKVGTQYFRAIMFVKTPLKPKKAIGLML